MKLPQFHPSAYMSLVIEPFLRQFHSENKGIQLQTDYALTGCNLGTGVVSTTYDISMVNKYGPPDCLIAHENEHVNYQTPCCQRAKLCFDKTTDNSCLNAYNKWFKANINNDECLAYTKEISCLESQISSGRFNSAAVQLLNTRLTEAKQFGTQFCKKAKAVACPFDDKGNIV